MTKKRKQIQVILKTPEEARRFGRGFYQVEEDCLYVPLHPARSFFSYLDSDQVQLDIDQAGRLVFISVSIPRRQWPVNGDLTAPEPEYHADIRLLNFREHLQGTRLETDPKRSLLKIIYPGDHKSASVYALAEHVSCEISEEGRLVALWISKIEDDRAARQMAAWRKMADEANAKEIGTGVPHYRRIEISSGE
jgi:hypothetical protein